MPINLIARLVSSGPVIDSSRIEADAGRRTEAGLKRFGAYVRRVAMNSIRYRNKKSLPGQPPSARRSNKFTRVKRDKKTGVESKQTSSPLRELIAFAVIDGGQTVIVGPMVFRSSAVGGGQAPPLLEKGGSGTFLADGKRKRGRWKARPFMGPAFRKSLPQAAKWFGPRQSKG